MLTDAQLEVNVKRKEYIAWDGYFMGLAAIASFRSKDPSTQNGACIVDPVLKSPLSLGYNGFPRGCSDDEFPWNREGDRECKCKYPFVEHAERNAIFNAARKGIGLENSVIYLYSEKGYYPCDGCARAIIQSGIRKVVMAFSMMENTDKYDWTATKKMFVSSGIIVAYAENLVLDFELMSIKMRDIMEKIKANRGN